MKTLKMFLSSELTLPAYTVWLLNTMSEYKGKQELFLKQSPEKLNALKESSIIESAVSSNRIEGIEIDKSRVGTVIFGDGVLADRNEEEVRGYKSALKWIHEEHDQIEINMETILKLHEMIKPDMWDSGKLKEKDGEIIEKHPDGLITVRFVPVSATETPIYLENLISLYNQALKEKLLPRLIVLAAFNLDFLSIHPFRDGNGRVSRLLILLMMYKSGYNAGKFVSVEKLIERSKERYYETLKASSDNWHEGKHNPWIYIDYLLSTLKELYAEFVNRFEVVSLLTSSDKKFGKELSKSSEKILNLIFENRTVTISEISETLQISTRAVEKQIRNLRESGKIKRVGGRKKGSWEIIEK
ncbi:MAG: Fic family protein [bacterium]